MHWQEGCKKFVNLFVKKTGSYSSIRFFSFIFVAIKIIVMGAIIPKVRAGNQFDYIWAIERAGIAVDLTTATDIELSYGVGKLCADYSKIPFTVVDTNKISSSHLYGVTGTYNLKLEFKIDGDQITIDIDAFKIVPRSEDASDSTQFAVTSDMAIGFKGDKGEKGEQGVDGVGLNYLGTVATSANLNPSYQGIANDAFVTEDLGRAWKWTGTQWLDVGSFKGEKGDTGLQGIQGVKGDKGDKGDKGAQGIQGIQGLKGNTGAQGLQGIQGIQGIQGTQGEKGDKGDKGDTGLSGIYNSEVVASPTTGTLTLKYCTETTLSTPLTNANIFTVAMPAVVPGKVNESILILKVGASLPTIAQPSGIVWRGAIPTLAINTNWTIVYEQVNTTGFTYEIWATACKNA